MQKHLNVIVKYIGIMISNSVIIYKQQEFDSKWISSALNHIKKILRSYENKSSIAVMMCNQLKYSLVILALMHLNIEAYLLHPTAPKEKIEYLKLKGIHIIRDQDIDLSNIEIVDTKIELNDKCQFVFSTSNTTSDSLKWVEVPAETLMTKSYMLSDVLEIKKTDCTYIVSPMCFIQTIWTLLVHLISSSKIWLDDFSVENLKVALRQNTITTMVTVPSIARTICNEIDNISSLRLLVLGGDFAKKELINSLKYLNSQLFISNVYGCTETAAADIILPPIEISGNTDVIYSLGKPSHFSDISLIDDNGTIVEDSYVVAQIYINGHYVAKKYHNSNKVICNKNGFATGDYAYRDENGYYYYIGRKSNVIKYNGQKIYALEVEEALLKLNGISDAVVFGKDDDKYGQVVNAIIVSNLLSKDQIVNELEKKLEKYKIPKKIYYVQSIPKTSTGKTIRNNRIYDELSKTIIN